MIKITNNEVAECVTALQNFKFSGATPAKWLMWKSKSLKELKGVYEDFEAGGRFDEEMAKVLEDYNAKLKEVHDECAKRDEGGNIKLVPGKNDPVIDNGKKAIYDEKTAVLKEEFKNLFEENDRITKEMKELGKAEVKVKIDRYNFKDIEDRELIENGNSDAVFIHLIK